VAALQGGGSSGPSATREAFIRYPDRLWSAVEVGRDPLFEWEPMVTTREEGDGEHRSYRGIKITKFRQLPKGIKLFAHGDPGLVNDSFSMAFGYAVPAMIMSKTIASDVLEPMQLVQRKLKPDDVIDWEVEVTKTVIVAVIVWRPDPRLGMQVDLQNIAIAGRRRAARAPLRLRSAPRGGLNEAAARVRPAPDQVSRAARGGSSTRTASRTPPLARQLRNSGGGTLAPDVVPSADAPQGPPDTRAFVQPADGRAGPRERDSLAARAAQARPQSRPPLDPVGFTNPAICGQAAHAYSWMSPPSRSRRRIAVWDRAPSGITRGEGSGTRSSSARCGRSRL
jgi:hypothetical protein